MTASTSPSHEVVLDTWFGPLDTDGNADAAHRARWFKKDPAFDRMLAERFGALLEACARGEHAEMCATPRGRLAYVIILDQFSRNIYRGTPEMFEQDARARAAAEQGLALGVDQELSIDERAFLYMPLMHAEDVAAQRRCCALFEQMLKDAPERSRASVANSLRFAVAHRDIVERFGRFPHRNAVLGRTSTPDENAFLLEPGSSF